MYTKSLPVIPFFRAKDHSRSELIGWAGLFCFVLAGSTSVPFAKEISTTLPPFSLLFISEMIALGFTVLSFGLVPLLKELRSLKKKSLPALLAVSLINGLVAPMIVLKGLSYTSAVNAELFLRSQSLFLFILAGIFLGQRLQRSHAMALTSVLIGIVIVGLEGLIEGPSVNFGDWIVLCGAIIYAGGNTLFKHSLHKEHPELVLFVRGLTIVGCYLLVEPWLETSFIEHLKAFPEESYRALIGYGGIATFLYLFGFYEAMDRLKVHTVSLALPLVTVGSVLFAHLYLGEAITWYHAFGGAFILFGSFVIQLSNIHLKDRHLEKNMKHHHRRHI